MSVLPELDLATSVLNDGSPVDLGVAPVEQQSGVDDDIDEFLRLAGLDRPPPSRSSLPPAPIVLSMQSGSTASIHLTAGHYDISAGRVRGRRSVEIVFRRRRTDSANTACTDAELSACTDTKVQP